MYLDYDQYYEEFVGHSCDNPHCPAWTDDMCRKAIVRMYGRAIHRPVHEEGHLYAEAIRMANLMRHNAFDPDREYYDTDSWY